MLLVCPKCGYSREIGASDISPSAVIATCPKCEEKFRFRDLQSPQAGNACVDDPPGMESRENPNNTAPWENLAEYGFFRGFFLTVFRVMLNPAQFFASMPLKGFGKPLVFYILLVEVIFLVHFFWQTTGILSSPQDPGETGTGLSPDSAFFLLVIGPFILTLLLFAGTGIMHLCLKCFDASAGGYEATFRAYSYGYAPMFLAVIPAIGPFLGLAWSIFATMTGYKYMHSTTLPRVVLAMFLPFFLLAVLSLFLSWATLA
ncbi:MAG: YIP1 family protein [Desulfovibrionales bacterium]